MPKKDCEISLNFSKDMMGQWQSNQFVAILNNLVPDIEAAESIESSNICIDSESQYD